MPRKLLNKVKLSGEHYVPRSILVNRAYITLIKSAFCQVIGYCSTTQELVSPCIS